MSILKITCFLFSTLISCFAIQQVWANEPKESFRLEIFPEKAVFNKNDDIRIMVKRINISNYIITAPLRTDKGAECIYDFSIKDENSNVPQKLSEVDGKLRVLICGGPSEEIEPGEESISSFVLNDAYFVKPGNYIIQAKVKYDESSPLSNIAEFTVE